MNFWMKATDVFVKIIIAFSEFGQSLLLITRGKPISDFSCYLIAVTNKILALTAEGPPIFTGWKNVQDVVI